MIHILIARAEELELRTAQQDWSEDHTPASVLEPVHSFCIFFLSNAFNRYQEF